jgi:hypothetical protein
MYVLFAQTVSAFRALCTRFEAQVGKVNELHLLFALSQHVEYLGVFAFLSV